MALVLRNGDYVPDGLGGFQRAEGAAEVLERVLWKLTVRRGSFPFLPGLGSRMYQLRREKSSVWETLARQFAAEALAGLDGVTVTGAQVERQDDWLLVSVALLWQGTRLSVTVQLEG